MTRIETRHSAWSAKFAHRRPRGLSVAIAVTITSLILFFYTAATAPIELFHKVALAFAVQIAAWAVCLMVAAELGPDKKLRIGNPLVLTLCLGGLYLIYPSITWCQDELLPFNVDMTSETASLLFFLHGLFFVGFTIGYVCSAPRRRTELRVDVESMQAPWTLFFLAMLPLAITTLARLASGGGLMSSSTYGDEWFETQAHIAAAHASGGLTYLLVQIESKTWAYPILAQGIAGGLLLARAVKHPRRSGLWILVLICATGAALVLLGTGGRSPSIVYVLIALIFCDTIAGPLQWRAILPIAAVGLVFFFFSGYVRAYRDLGFRQAIEVGFQEYQQDRGSETAVEFTSMLAKEALAVRMTHDNGFEGPMYLVRGILGLIPSQLLPNKLKWQDTGEVLSREMLGTTADLGAGVAGTSVGDGYEFAGPGGVFLLAALFGIIFGRVRAWGMRYSVDGDAPVMLKVGLMAGLTGFTYLLIRSSFGEVLTYLLYIVVVPWYALSVALGKNQRWLGPAPLLSLQQRNVSLPNQTFPTHGYSKI